MQQRLDNRGGLLCRRQNLVLTPLDNGVVHGEDNDREDEDCHDHHSKQHGLIGFEGLGTRSRDRRLKCTCSAWLTAGECTHRDMGNSAFKDGRYDDAITYCTQAVIKDDTEYVSR
jgi:hypothetical protein